MSGRSASLTLAASIVLIAAPARAQEGIFQGMQKGVQLTTSSVSSTTTFASGLVTRTESTSIFPSLTLNVDTLVYPSLRLNTGGVFELNMANVTTDGGSTDSTITRNRPFFLLRSTNPTFSPGFGYFRREDRARTAGLSDIKLVNDEYDGYLGWNPAGGPRSDFQILRMHTYDGSRAFQDVVKGFGSLISNYTYGNLNAYYRGSYLSEDDRILALNTQQISHAARVSDSGSLIRHRLVWDATYNINYQDVRTLDRGAGGEVPLPVTPFGGLAALSDTPTTSTLAANGALIDGNLTASAGIDIGPAAPPANTQDRNIGVDFLNPTTVNRFLVWVDRDLPFEISNSFSWDIYSSTDNIIWRRETTVATAPFGPFDTRFQIDFPDITARYVKVVVHPLSAATPDASRFADIFVTEMQAFSRRSAAEIDNRITQTTHLVNTDVRMRILDVPSLFYEGFFLYNGPSAFGTSTTTLSNGVSFNDTFGRIYSAYARAAREQGTEPRGDRVATVANATFTVDPIPTFRSSLLYSGQDERVAGLVNTRRGVFVQNSAQVYRGVDVLFGVGWNFTTHETGETVRDRLVNATATIVPRQHVSFTFSYDQTASDRSGTFLGSPHTNLRRVYGAIAVDPARTFHLVLGGEAITATDQRTRKTLDVGVNWAPFPDGALQFVFAHNESLRALEFGNDKSTVGLVRWNLSRKSYVDVSYQRTTSEFVFQTTRSRVFSITLRLFA